MFAGWCGAALVGLVCVFFVLGRFPELPLLLTSGPLPPQGSSSAAIDKFRTLSAPFQMWRNEALGGGGADVGKLCCAGCVPPPPAGPQLCASLLGLVRTFENEQLPAAPGARRRCHVNGGGGSLRCSLSAWLHLHPPLGAGGHFLFSVQGWRRRQQSSSQPGWTFLWWDRNWLKTHWLNVT